MQRQVDTNHSKWTVGMNLVQASCGWEEGRIRKSFTKKRSGKVAKGDLCGEESADLPHRGSSRHRNETWKMTPGKACNQTLVLEQWWKRSRERELKASVAAKLTLFCGSLHLQMIFLSFDPDAGKDWGQEEKHLTEDVMVGWHHWPMDMSLSKFREVMKDREPWCARFIGLQRVRHDLATEQQQEFHCLRILWLPKHFSQPEIEPVPPMKSKSWGYQGSLFGLFFNQAVSTLIVELSDFSVYFM